MIFITGGLASGKRTYARTLEKTCDTQGAPGTPTAAAPEPCTRAGEIPPADVIFDAQNLVCGTETDAELVALAQALAEKRIVIATEIGTGVVPIEPSERAKREAAGRLACLLAERARTVVRMCCGIASILKETRS